MKNSLSLYIGHELAHNTRGHVEAQTRRRAIGGLLGAYGRRAATGDCFSLNPIPSFIFGTPAQGSTSSPPGNRPCTGEVPIPCKEKRGAGALCPPAPSKKAPPLPPFFLVLVQGRRTEPGRAVNRPDPPPCSGRHGQGCSQAGAAAAPNFCTFAPLFAVRHPADAHRSAFEWQRSGPVPFVLAGQPIDGSGGVGLQFPLNQLQEVTAFFRFRVLPKPGLKIDSQRTFGAIAPLTPAPCGGSGSPRASLPRPA